MLPFLFEMFLHLTFYMLIDTPLLSTSVMLSPRRDTWDLPSEPQQLINFFLMRRCGLFVLPAQASLSFVTFTTFTSVPALCLLTLLSLHLSYFLLILGFCSLYVLLRTG
jgi:hypothetical protein